ncbi:MAG: hypothetical protein QM606_08835 [Leucobacter sp.]
MSSEMQVDEQAHTVSGEFGGDIAINATDALITGDMGCSLRLRGPFSTLSILKPDGTPWKKNDFVYLWGITWLVYSIAEVSQGVYTVNFFSDRRFIWESTTFTLPTARYSGTYVAGQPQPLNPLKAEILCFVNYLNYSQPKTVSSTYPS